MVECMLVTKPFRIKELQFNKGELYMSSPQHRKSVFDAFNLTGQINKTSNKIDSYCKFFNFDDIFKKTTAKNQTKNIFIVRYGGIGDLIALSSIIDYFENSNIHFITDKKYFPIFEWFENKPILYDCTKPIAKNFKLNQDLGNWSKFQGEGIIETGHSKNWFELFFEFIDENEPDSEYLRPQLITDRINYNKSNINRKNGKKSLLICNKATAMMRTIAVSEIISSLPSHILQEWDIFVYYNNLSENDISFIKNCEHFLKINIISANLKTFLLDCFDADMVISVDTGALHFREAIHKPAIGLYNSFTTDARTKYYQYTKSFDIKSNCNLQPCFIHERPDLKHCPKGTKESFAAPCFDSKYNLTLHEQLSKIFKENL